ncbi:MAG TPA: hypothetical protein VMT96_00830 [Candidatus Bathyarchaeia archaeon]|nr:hypothetical protein [Candidatus Bathyarchaeia archaeon]
MEKGDLLRATAAVIAGISIVWCLITCIWGWIWAAVVTILAFAVACAYVWLFVSGNKPHENEASFRRLAGTGKLEQECAKYPPTEKPYWA